MPAAHWDVVPGGCLCPPHSRQRISRCVGSVCDQRQNSSAHLSWLHHVPMKQAATPRTRKKAPGRMGTGGKKRAGKSSQGLAGREGSGEHPTLCRAKLCPTVQGQVVPHCVPGCQTGLSQTVPC